MVGLGDDYLEHFVGPGGRDHRPVLVSLEVGERNSARRFQQVLVLRVDSRGAEDGERCRGHRNRELASALMADPFESGC
jgi:hypothetical protein